MPHVNVIAGLGLLSAAGLMATLPADTWLRLFVWLLIGFVIYFGYGRKHSVLQQERNERRARRRAGELRVRRELGLVDVGHGETADLAVVAGDLLPARRLDPEALSENGDQGARLHRADPRKSE